VVAVLYLAREILAPPAIAVTLSLILAPASVKNLGKELSSPSAPVAPPAAIGRAERRIVPNPAGSPIPVQVVDSDDADQLGARRRRALSL
jgi:hypothetical protein